MKKVIVSATSDLSTDQRVHRICGALQKSGYEVLVIGRKKRNSNAVGPREYKVKRFSLIFEKGFLFYAEYNLTLFFYLLTHKTDLLYANDLDTLLPNYLVSKFYGARVIYDSHEYYCGTPELMHRPFVQGIWRWLEKWMVPKIKSRITVSDSIARQYNTEYKVHFEVVRNIPEQNTGHSTTHKADLSLPENKKIILYQGSGINIDRGLEEMMDAMEYIDDAVLFIVGDGDVLPELKQKQSQLKWKDRIRFHGKVSPEILRSITPLANLGLSLDKNTNLNYRFSLPNKIFDYIHAGVPVFVSNLDEVKHIVKTYQIGEVFDSHQPQKLGRQIADLLSNTEKLLQYSRNCAKAAEELNWEKEELKLLRVIQET